MTIPLRVQRDPDQAGVVDEPIEYGLAAMLTMPGEMGMCEEARPRIAPVPGAEAAANGQHLLCRRRFWSESSKRQSQTTAAMARLVYLHQCLQHPNDRQICALLGV
jgi:hypothetical protein